MRANIAISLHGTRTMKFEPDPRSRGNGCGAKYLKARGIVNRQITAYPEHHLWCSDLEQRKAVAPVSDGTRSILQQVLPQTTPMIQAIPRPKITRQFHA